MQAASFPTDSISPAGKAAGLIREASRGGARLIVFSEGFFLDGPEVAPPGYAPSTVHGFRSSFRDWCGETSGTQALAHHVGNELERAYRRGDSRARRSLLMQQWFRYLVADTA